MGERPGGTGGEEWELEDVNPTGAVICCVVP